MISHSNETEMRKYLSKLASKILVLEQESAKIHTDVISANDEINNFSRHFHRSINRLGSELIQAQQELDDCNAQMQALISLIKRTLKKDLYYKLEDSVHSTRFEQYVTDDEFNKLLALSSTHSSRQR